MNKKRIIVIDDSETNLLLFESMFEGDDRVEVYLRNSGKEILDYCRLVKPDLILLDLMMPEINGFEVLEALQSDDLQRDVPVIIISALEGQEDIKRAIELGAMDYIIKPVDYDENAKMILNVLGLD